MEQSWGQCEEREEWRGREWMQGMIIHDHDACNEWTGNGQGVNKEWVV